MKTTIRLFGPEAQALGVRTVDVDCDGQTTCGMLRSRLIAMHPQHEPLLAPCRIAVNHEFADDDHVVGDGDEVALIGQVSGG